MTLVWGLSFEVVPSLFVGPPVNRNLAKSKLKEIIEKHIISVRFFPITIFCHKTAKMHFHYFGTFTKALCSDSEFFKI